MRFLNTTKPWIPFIWIFIIVLIIIILIGFLFSCNSDYGFDWAGVYTESIGMLLDVLFLGIIWAILEYLRNNKLEIKRCLNEIDDFRRWKSEEAMHKIVGNIRRLKKLKYTNLDLTYCYLKDAELWNLKLTGDATGANFYNSKLAGAELQNINLSYVNFEKAHLYKAKLNGSTLISTNFNKANLTDVDFRGCHNVDKAFFWGAVNIWKAIFDEGVNIDDLKNQKRQTDKLGSTEDRKLKIKFIEDNFNCTLLEFHISQINEESIVLRFTKEGFLNYKNLIKITGEHRNFYNGLIPLEDLNKELKSTRD